MSSALMGFLWRKIAPLNSRHKRALNHLEQALPETTAQQRAEIVNGMWDNLGRVAAETFHISQLLKEESRFELNVDPVTRQVLNGERPALFVSLHTGNWELCVQPVASQGLQLAGVYQALKNPGADEFLRSMRKDLYPAGLYSKGHQTARKLLTLMRGGGTVAIMGDLREVRGIQVPFFGRAAYATPVPASLARAANVPIIVGRVIRTRGVHFLIEGKSISIPRTDDRQADIQTATEEMHRIFENWIREYPDQWMWIHRKWAGT